MMACRRRTTWLLTGLKCFGLALLPTQRAALLSTALPVLAGTVMQCWNCLTLAEEQVKIIILTFQVNIVSQNIFCRGGRRHVAIPNSF